VLADEPTAALDPSATRQVCDALRALAEPAGRTLVSVVHDPELLPLLATRVIGIANGEIQWDVAIGALNPDRLQELYRPRSGGTVTDSHTSGALHAGTRPLNLVPSPHFRRST
jgi:phosphonate transport system ATP-binding protein